MIPRSQHFRDPAPFPFKWSGVMRIFEQPLFEALVISAGSRAHYSGKQPNASIEEGQSGDFAAGKYIISDRYGQDRPRLEQPFVDSFEPAAQDRDPRPGGELAHQ